MLSFKKEKHFNYDNKIPTENLYISLIGNIISNTNYIESGERARYYTVVKKEDKYIDVFNNCEYNYRDKNDSYTILKMTKYPTNDVFTTLDKLCDSLNRYNDILEYEIKKSLTIYNKTHVRTRKID